MKIYLTTEELQGITGFKKASAQVRALRRMGFQFITRADGSPLVSRAHFELLLCGLPIAGSIDTDEPDFSSLQ